VCEQYTASEAQEAVLMAMAPQKKQQNQWHDPSGKVGHQELHVKLTTHHPVSKKKIKQNGICLKSAQCCEKGFGWISSC